MRIKKWNIVLDYTGSLMKILFFVVESVFNAGKSSFNISIPLKVIKGLLLLQIPRRLNVYHIYAT